MPLERLNYKPWKYYYVTLLSDTLMEYLAGTYQRSIEYLVERIIDFKAASFVQLIDRWNILLSFAFLSSRIVSVV